MSRKTFEIFGRIGDDKNTPAVQASSTEIATYVSVAGEHRCGTPEMPARRGNRTIGRGRQRTGNQRCAVLDDDGEYFGVLPCA